VLRLCRSNRRMQRSTARAVSLVASFIFLFAVAARAQPDCPGSLVVGDLREAPPSGWERLGVHEQTLGRRSLRHVGFSDGHPREMAFLRPNSNRLEANGDRTDVYRFSPVSNDGIWIVCQYEHTRQTLSRPLTASTCEVVESDQPERRVRSVFCQ
jgi:hypothetical protein